MDISSSRIAKLKSRRYVDGPALGSLLAETEVPVLVLNACRSAHADLVTAPDDMAAARHDVHQQVRTYGSLAQEVVDAGVPGVVAMRYNVWVATAAQFVADLYGSLVLGESLGKAVTDGRKQLWARPERHVFATPLSLQDWLVPIAYEAAPVRLLRRTRRPTGAVTRLSDGQLGAQQPGSVSEAVPAPPDVGFHGRDETLLALDRAFDNHRIVLLHGYAGSGKLLLPPSSPGGTG